MRRATSRFPRFEKLTLLTPFTLAYPSYRLQRHVCKALISRDASDRLLDSHMHRWDEMNSRAARSMMRLEQSGAPLINLKYHEICWSLLGSLVWGRRTYLPLFQNLVVVQSNLPIRICFGRYLIRIRETFLGSSPLYKERAILKEQGIRIVGFSYKCLDYFD
jgi:hypothetical protein